MMWQVADHSLSGAIRDEHVKLYIFTSIFCLVFLGNIFYTAVKNHAQTAGTAYYITIWHSFIDYVNFM